MFRPTLWHRLNGSPQPLPGTRLGPPPAVTIRLARPSDAQGLGRLAQLDSSRMPRGRVLVAEVDGELWAAVSVEDHHAVADPFRLTGELVWLLHERARQLGRAVRDRAPRPLARRRPLLGTR